MELDAEMGFASDLVLAMRRLPQVAAALGHDQVDSGHILLALVREMPSFFREHCEPAALEAAALRQVAPPAPARADPPTELPLTPAAVTALGIAIREAQEGEYSQVLPTHLVLGILLEHEGSGAAALREVGLASPDVWRPKLA